MAKTVIYSLVCILLLGCRNDTSSKQPETSIELVEGNDLGYAKSFKIERFTDYTLLTITTPWPNANKEFRYAVVEKKSSFPSNIEVDEIIEAPLQRLVVTSTTHIPSLEMLGVEERLVGFPNLEYISSSKTRKRIDENMLTELGKNESINTEVLIDLAPDALITFAVDSDNKTVATIQKTGIPVLYNADWTETSPLGKAEWIKFFGVLVDKEALADSIFKSIESNYLAAKELASTAAVKPTVLSGAMYKDVWYLPQGNSWAAQFIEDANANYLWNGSNGTGSLSLTVESVVNKASDADYWIGPGQFSSYKILLDAHPAYAQFKPIASKNVYNFTSNKGETGGIIYFELAPNRPDLVLKDLIKIFHPEIDMNHQLYFFSPLK